MANKAYSQHVPKIVLGALLVTLILTLGSVARESVALWQSKLEYERVASLESREWIGPEAKEHQNRIQELERRMSTQNQLLFKNLIVVVCALAIGYAERIFKDKAQGA